MENSGKVHKSINLVDQVAENKTQSLTTNFSG